MKASGAAGAPHAPSPPSEARTTAVRVAAPEHCGDARRAIRYYQRQERLWRDKMGAGASPTSQGTTSSCPHVRYLAKQARARAQRARAAYLKWSYEWEWQKWMPAKFQRVAMCETHQRWDWDSGTYVSAFGIIRSGYATFAHALGLPAWDETRVHTPRQEYLVAAALQRRYSWSAWGCRNA